MFAYLDENLQIVGVRAFRVDDLADEIRSFGEVMSDWQIEIREGAIARRMGMASKTGGRRRGSRRC